MRAAALALALLVAGGAETARAETFDVRDLCRHAAALAQSLIGGGNRDADVIAPRGGTDPQMALMPPRSGTRRVIPPAARPCQQ
jgi:hypothetical protein